MADTVLVSLIRPEGYEDVHPELIVQDAKIDPAFQPKVVKQPKKTATRLYMITPTVVQYGGGALLIEATTRKAAEKIADAHLKEKYKHGDLKRQGSADVIKLTGKTRLVEDLTWIE